MTSIDLSQEISGRQRAVVLAACTAVAALLLFIEMYIGPVVGPLYFLPLLVAAAYIPRWVGFFAAIGAAVLREVVSPPMSGPHTATGLALNTIAFTGATLFAGELVEKRRIAQALMLKTRERADAAQEIRALIEGTPAAVITVGPDAKIAMANRAAKRLLGFADSTPEGEPVESFLPFLSKFLNSPRKIGVMVEAAGARRNGDPFHAQLWVSSYDSAQGPRLAAIIADVTEDLRDREEAGLRQLLSSSRIIAAAVSHEIRNLTGGAAVLYDNLTRVGALAGNPDFQALGNVIDSVQKLSSDELQENTAEVLEGGVELPRVLEELRLIMMPAFEETGAALQFDVPQTLPPVRAAHSGLLQVFINLAQNSCRALKGTPSACLRIAAYPLNDSVVVRFSDNGPGLPSSAGLFQPFLRGSTANGLGLFISRSVVRTFGGELHHTQKPGECCFIVELPAATYAESTSA